MTQYPLTRGQLKSLASFYVLNISFSDLRCLSIDGDIYDGLHNRYDEDAVKAEEKRLEAEERKTEQEIQEWEQHLAGKGYKNR